MEIVPPNPTTNVFGGFEESDFPNFPDVSESAGILSHAAKNLPTFPWKSTSKLVFLEQRA